MLLEVLDVVLKVLDLPWGPQVVYKQFPEKSGLKKKAKLKSYSPGTHSNRSGTVDLYRKIFAPGL